MKRVVIPCLAALALIAAGCGGDEVSKDEYESSVRSAGTALEKTFGSLGSSLSDSSSPEDAAKELEQGADALDKAAGDLGDIEAPSEIEDAHDDVVEGLAALADEFREGAKAAAGGDVDSLVEFATSLQSSAAVRKITAAGEKIESEGYSFESERSAGSGSE